MVSIYVYMTSWLGLGHYYSVGDALYSICLAYEFRYIAHGRREKMCSSWRLGTLITHRNLF
jgi:hypothetical protein